MRLVLLGAPGTGKGTQAESLRDRLGLAHVSTGEALREAVRRGTELGRQARAIMEAGRLVPDALVGGLVEERLGRRDARERGFLLDGFPRNEAQVTLLDGILERLGAGLDAVVLLRVEDEEILRRLTGRRTCESCGAIFHAQSSPPRREGVCDACGGRLLQRADDRPEVVAERLDVYRRETEPVVAVYRERGLLREVEGLGAPDAVLERLLKALGRGAA